MKATFLETLTAFAATKCPSENTCAWVISISGGPPRPHSSATSGSPPAPRTAYPSSSPHPRHAQPAPNCGPRRGCGRERPKQEEGRRAREARAHHGEAGEQSRGPAGGFELGAAQVELAPGQRLHRVLVEAHHLGVTLADPVRVADGGRRRRQRQRWGPRGLPVPAAAAAPAAAASATAAAQGKLGIAVTRGRGRLRMHGVRCEGAAGGGRLRRLRPRGRAAPPPASHWSLGPAVGHTGSGGRGD